MKIFKIILFIAVLVLSIFLRFYNLDSVPSGLNADEASLGYDAYSILLTGKDQYGKAFPIFLRSFGSYQSPLYAYLSTLPVFLFGLSVFSVRFVSALFGVMTIIATFIIVYKYSKTIKFWQALIVSFIISFIPWSVFFSRTAVEANLGLFLVVLATYFLLRSLQRPTFLYLAGTFLGISTYAYQAQRLGSIIFFLGFLLIFAKQFVNKKRVMLISLTLFLIIQIPQLMLINSEAGSRRLTQVNYFSKDFFDQNGGGLKVIPFGHYIYIFNQFSSHYLAYFSPRNLFLDPDPQRTRSIPDLSVFYSWMFVPFLFGIKVFWESRKEPFVKIMLLLIVTSVIPAALTREPFYTLRVLPLLWVLSILISLGSFDLLSRVKWTFLRVILLLTVLALSLAILFINYFILLKYERSLDYGFPFIELAKKSEELSSKKFIIDLGRQNQSYIWFAFFKKYDPHKLQEQGKDVLNNYYDAADFNGNRIIGNVEFKDINWGKDPCKSQIIVGDLIAISEAQAKEHGLYLEFDIPDMTEKVKLKAYMTDPKTQCN